MLAVRACASARGRLSTVLVGGRLSRNHAQHAMFLPTSFRIICSVSEFLMLCVVRNVCCCCRLVPGLGIVGHANLWPFARDMVYCEMVTIRMRVCHSAFCVRLQRFVYFRFLSRFWVSQACCRHMLSSLCLVTVRMCGAC